jgi:hypothetical protein
MEGRSAAVTQQPKGHSGRGGTAFRRIVFLRLGPGLSEGGEAAL